VVQVPMQDAGRAQLDELVGKIPNCEYRDYLAEVVAEAKRLK